MNIVTALLAVCNGVLLLECGVSVVSAEAAEQAAELLGTHVEVDLFCLSGPFQMASITDHAHIGSPCPKVLRHGFTTTGEAIGHKISLQGLLMSL